MKRITIILFPAIFSACIILCANSDSFAGVEADGSFSYTIPIEIPQGTAGCAPSLALVYNSNSGNDMLGMGWSLAGLGAITRDTTHLINYNSSDYFVGPEGRMVRITTGDFAGDYHYENESFCRIELYGTAGDAESYWLETKPDGTKYYYGYTDGECSDTNSKIAAEGKGTQLRAWALSKVEDLHGNYYTVSYYQDSGEYYPDTITYTDNNYWPISDKRTLVFNYISRNDYHETYTFGCSVQTKWLLNSIEEKLDGSTIRTYIFSYAAGVLTGRSRLMSIVDDRNADGIYKFIWKSDTEGFSSITAPIANLWGSSSFTRTGDFNEDGRTDVVSIIPASNGTGVTFAMYRSSGSILSSGIWINPNCSLGTSEYTWTGDFNGDGRTDIASASGANVYMYLSTGSKFNYEIWTVPNNWGTSGFTWAGDFNGDGRTDIISRNGTYQYIHLSTGSGFSSITGPIANLWGSSSFTRTGDFNGDGSTDVVSIIPTTDGIPGVAFAMYRSSGGILSSGIWINTNCYMGTSGYTWTGDFNGDGRTDIASASGANVYMYLSTGSKFNYEIWTVPNNWGTSGFTWAGDFNGDGRTDIASASGGNIYVHLSTGRGFTNKTWAVPSNWGTSGFTWAGDYNGDGKTDIVSVSGTSQYMKYPYAYIPDTLISISRAVNDVSAYTTSITYAHAAQFGDAISDGVTDKVIDPASTTYPSVYPYITNNSVRNLVSRITIDDGQTDPNCSADCPKIHTYTTKYSYKNGKRYMNYSYLRRDMFFECITERTGTGPYTKTYYRIEDQNLAGKIDRVESYDQNNNLIKKQQFAYSYSTPYTRITWVRATSIAESIYESGSANLIFTNTKSFVYDPTYGNPVQMTEHSSDSGLPDIVTITSYNIDQNAWILIRPSEITQHQGSSTGTMLNQQRFYYNAKNELSSKELWAGGSNYIITSFTYDNWGNAATITAPNAAGTAPTGGTSTTYIYYDTDYHTFPERIVNYNGSTMLEVHTHFNPANGNKLYIIDPNGNTIYYNYDSFGRIIEVVEPEVGWTKRISYQNWGDPNNQYIEVRLRDNSSEGYYYEREYFDGLKRKYKAESEGYETYNKITEYEYDSLGRLYRQSNSYLDGCGETKYYTVFEYDASGRISRKTYPDNTPDQSDNPYDEITYPYTAGDYQQVVRLKDRKGQTHTSWYDSRGNLRTKKDDGIAYINYYYDALGRLTGTGGSQPATSITYDALGRKTSMTDPNTGTTTYTYYNSGQIATQTDARNITIAYSYDQLNRLINEQSSDGTLDVRYYYDTGATNNLKGKLYRVTDETGETIFSYDQRGLVTQYIKGIDVNGDGATDKQFAVAMTYDYQRRIASITYPDPNHTVIKMQYADAGYLKAVTDAGNNAFVQYTREAGSGGSLCSLNSVKRITGNGIVSTISYDPATLRPMSLLTKKDDAVLENIGYTSYDKMGNITKITDLYPGDPNDNNIDDTETFTYDSINRLIKAESPWLYGTYNYAYSANGNLTTKDNLSLTYGDSAHPHAVTAYDGKTYSYDANGNMILRNGKTYVYDAKNRLIQVINGGTIEERYFYDYTGFRVGKMLANGTLVCNINGLYELRQIPGQTLLNYTNFIYGMNGDLVAQITGTTTFEEASIFPISQNMYNWKDFRGFFLKFYASASAFFENPDNVRQIYIFLFALSVLGAFALWLYNAFLRRRREMPIPRWMVHVIPCLLVILFSTFGLTGCFEGLFSNSTVDGIYYFHPNHNGSIKMITRAENGAVSVVARYKYSPYGELLADKSSGTEISKYKYTGQEEDSTTGLFYYKARFYDPDTGRFITADSIVPNPTSIQAFNRYMYADGNPVNLGDPTGFYSWNQFWKDCKKVVKDIVNDAILRSAYKEGGWDNVFLNVYTAGILSHTNEGGMGITISGQWKCFYGGVHWQQKGWNEGWTVFGGVGYQKGKFVAGAYAGYNLNKHYTTLGARVGCVGQYGQAGIGYYWMWNKDGKLVYHGVSGYGRINYMAFLTDTEKEMQTSEREGGRHKQAVWGKFGDEHITGLQNPTGNWIVDSLFLETSPLMELLDATILHPVAVIHDNRTLMTDLNFEFFALMVPCAMIAWAGTGPNYFTNPYGTDLKYN